MSAPVLHHHDLMFDGHKTADLVHEHEIDAPGHTHFVEVTAGWVDERVEL